MALQGGGGGQPRRSCFFALHATCMNMPMLMSWIALPRLLVLVAGRVTCRL